MAHFKKVGITQDVVYDDMAGSLIGNRLNSTAGKVVYDYAEMALKFSPGGSISTANDLANVNLQYPHQASETGKIYPHIHWEQNSSDVIKFQLQYRIQKNGQEKTTAWTDMYIVSGGENASHGVKPTSNAFTWNGGGYTTLNQISMFNTNADGVSGNTYIDMTGSGISATIQFKFTRIDSETGDKLVAFFDYHYEIDSDGSRSEYVK